MTGVKQMPSQAALCRLLIYEPATGKLFWRKRSADLFVSVGAATRWNNRYPGEEAFTAVTRNRYRVGAIQNTLFYAHRIIWKMVYDEEPPQIDHVNGRRGDNRIVNLARSSATHNGKNQRRRSDTSTGVTGVCFDKSKNNYMAYINENGKRKYLGRFKTLDEAAHARKQEAIKRGFNVRHGR